MILLNKYSIFYYIEYGLFLDFALTGTVRSMEINTYGQGTWEGFGSAGNYWEATIRVTDIENVRYTDKKMIWLETSRSTANLRDARLNLSSAGRRPG